MKIAEQNNCEEAGNEIECWKTDLYEDIVRLNKRHHSSGPNQDKLRLEYILDAFAQETSPLCDGCDCSNPLLVNPDVPSKNPKVSLNYRNQGNDLFQKNQLDQAAEAYTRSLASAPSNSEEFAVAAGNRSMVFFKTNLFFDCLEDINTCLRSNYPDNLKAKLYHRKACCQQALKSTDQSGIKKTLAKARYWVQKMSENKQQAMLETINDKSLLKSYENKTCYKWGYQDILPELDTQNPAIPGMSDAVEMKYSKKYGRHMVATRDIKPGELIGIQKPYVRVVDLKMRFKCCWHCGKQTWSSLPCGTCSEVVYCSAACRDNSWKEYHDLECELMRQLFAYGGPLQARNSYVLPLRLTIMAYKEAGCSLDNLKKMVKKIEAVPDLKKKAFFDEKELGSKFSTVHCMSTQPMGNDNAYAVFCTNAILTVFCLSIKIGLHTAERDTLTDLYVMVDDNFKFLVDLTLKNIWNMIYNGYEISLGDDNVLVAKVIAPTFSYFNHSCIPNLTFNHYNYGEYFATRSIAPIKNGEQVFVSYGAKLLNHDKFERDEYLKKYNFECNCEACLYDLPLMLFGDPEVTNGKSQAIDEIIKASSLSAGHVSRLAESTSNYSKIHNRAMDVSKLLSNHIRFVEKISNICKRKNFIPVLVAVATLEKTFFLTQKNILYLK